MDDGDERCVYARARAATTSVDVGGEAAPHPPQATPRIKEPVSYCQALTSRFD